MCFACEIEMFDALQEWTVERFNRSACRASCKTCHCTSPATDLGAATCSMMCLCLPACAGRATARVVRINSNDRVAAHDAVTRDDELRAEQ